MAYVIRKSEQPDVWEKLMGMYQEQGAEAGWVTVPGGQQYRILKPSGDLDSWCFVKETGFDDMYGDTTRGLP